jgi:hypothetical protein
VPDTWRGDGFAGALDQAMHGIDKLHATRLRLMLVCAHDFQVVECGPDSLGYPIKYEKDWVKKLYENLTPVLKYSLLAAKAVMAASGAGFAVPLVSHFLPKIGEEDGDAVAKLGAGFAEHLQEQDLEKQQEGIDSMLESVDAQFETLGSMVEESDELTRTLECADGAATSKKTSEELKAWTGDSYRYLRALLEKHGENLEEHTGLTKVVSESSGAVEWVAPHNVEAWQRQQEETAHGVTHELVVGGGAELAADSGGGVGQCAEAGCSASGSGAAAAPPPRAPAAPRAEVACGICKEQFSVWKRHRQRCSQCAQAVCAGCSPGRKRLPGMQGEQRVCRECAPWLQAAACQICEKGFSYWKMRWPHHCRACNRAICNGCCHKEPDAAVDALLGLVKPERRCRDCQALEECMDAESEFV